MNSFGLLFVLMVGAFSLGAPVSSLAREAIHAPSGASSGKTAPQRAGARLKLEPLDLGVELEPQLKMSASLGDLSEVPPKQRAQAAALWQALNTTPEDVLRTAQRGQALAGDMDKLRESMTRNADSLADLHRQLAQAQESQKHWRYGLIAVLVISVLVVTLAWRRSVSRERDPQWWRDSNVSFAPSQPEWLDDSLASHARLVASRQARRAAPQPPGGHRRK